MGKKFCEPIVLLLAVFSALLPVHAKDKKQPSLPAALNEAHTVYVEAVYGREFDANLDAPDREAIADVRDALRGWNRYVFTSERGEADLVFVVRKGRIAEGESRGGVDRDPIAQDGQMGAQMPGAQRPAGSTAGPGMGSGSGPGMGPGTGPGIGTGPGMGPDTGMGPDEVGGGMAGSADDLFEVCQIKPNGKRTAPLWTRSLRGGLDSPRLVLFQQFRDAVERAYPSQPGQAAKP